MELIDKIESVLEDGEISRAIELLENNADEIGVVGCEYLQGRIYHIIDDYSEAERHLNNALQGNPSDKVIYAELADVYEKSGKLSEAENAYETLINLEESGSKMKWAIYTYLAEFYKRHEMWLKIENIGKRLKDEYPNNYMGIHWLFEAGLAKGKMVQCDMLLKNIPERFQNHNAYVLDCIRLYKEKIKIYIRMGDYEAAEENIGRLAMDYGDVEALISLMILFVLKEKNEESIMIGEYLLKNLDKTEIHYIYLVKAVSVMSKYRLYIRKEPIDHSQVKEEFNDLIQYMENTRCYDDEAMKFWMGFREQ